MLSNLKMDRNKQLSNVDWLHEYTEHLNIQF